MLSFSKYAVINFTTYYIILFNVLFPVREVFIKKLKKNLELPNYISDIGKSTF